MKKQNLKEIQHQNTANETMLTHQSSDVFNATFQYWINAVGMTTETKKTEWYQAVLFVQYLC